jgi:hypothetical protein
MSGLASVVMSRVSTRLDVPRGVPAGQVRLLVGEHVAAGVVGAGVLPLMDGPGDRVGHRRIGHRQRLAHRGVAVGRLVARGVQRTRQRVPVAGRTRAVRRGRELVLGVVAVGRSARGTSGSHLGHRHRTVVTLPLLAEVSRFASSYPYVVVPAPASSPPDVCDVRFPCCRSRRQDKPTSMAAFRKATKSME